MRNFTASLKKEWLELTRTRRIWLYGLVIVVCLVCNWVLVLLNVPVHNSYTEVSYNMQTRYGAVVSFNVCVMTIYLLALLIMLRPIITGELKQKRLVQPFAMGLSPTANIVAKYIIQALVPSALAFVAVLINGAIACFVFGSGSFYSISTGAINVNFLSVLISALCVFAVVLLYVVMEISVSTYFKSGIMGLAVSLVIMLLGLVYFNTVEISMYMPNLLRLTAMKLATNGTTAQYLFSSMVSVSLVLLFAISATIVYTDRNDLAI